MLRVKGNRLFSSQESLEKQLQAIDRLKSNLQMATAEFRWTLYQTELPPGFYQDHTLFSRLCFTKEEAAILGSNLQHLHSINGLTVLYEGLLSASQISALPAEYVAHLTSDDGVELLRRRLLLPEEAVKIPTANGLALRIQELSHALKHSVEARGFGR